MTGAFGGKAVHDAVLVAVILPLDARYNPKVNFHRLHEITANALHDWFPSWFFFGGSLPNRHPVLTFAFAHTT